MKAGDRVSHTASGRTGVVQEYHGEHLVVVLLDEPWRGGVEWADGFHRFLSAALVVLEEGPPLSPYVVSETSRYLVRAASAVEARETFKRLTPVARNALLKEIDEPEVFDENGEPCDLTKET
jgi:hypothetical protein